MGSEPTVTIVPNPDALADAAARLTVDVAAHAIATRGRFMWPLAGGEPPGTTWGRPAPPPFRERVDWRRTWVFFGDERAVPPDHAGSNYRMAHETLLSKVPIPAAQVLRIRGEAEDLEVAAAEYARALGEAFGTRRGALPRFDLVLLGLGVDGHTASLFPDSPVVREVFRAVAAVHVAAGAPGRRRWSRPSRGSGRHFRPRWCGRPTASSSGSSTAPPRRSSPRPRKGNARVRRRTLLADHLRRVGRPDATQAHARTLEPLRGARAPRAVHDHRDRADRHGRRRVPRADTRGDRGIRADPAAFRGGVGAPRPGGLVRRRRPRRRLTLPAARARAEGRRGDPGRTGEPALLLRDTAEPLRRQHRQPRGLRPRAPRGGRLHAEHHRET